MFVRLVFLSLCFIGSLVFPAVDATCEVFFSQRDPLARKLIELIDGEQKSIKAAIYCMTHKEIASALVRAKERGVAVEVIVDPFSVKQRSSLSVLVKGQVPLFVWDHLLCSSFRGRGKHSGNRPLMHDKFCVFGDRLVWTGSFNFTYDAASLHQENAVTIQSKEVANKYLDQFSHMKLYESRTYLDFLAHHPKKGRKK